MCMSETNPTVHSTVPLSIVVPCYNESKNIPLILKRLCVVAQQQPGVEVILVNNGSTDDSATVLKSQLTQDEWSFIQVVTVSKNIGYGHGIMAGLHVAHGEVLAWTHADMQTDPLDVLAGYQRFQQLNQPDKIILKGKRIHRRFGEWAFTFGMSCIASAVLMTRLSDVNAQPKIFHHSLLTKLANPPTDFSLDLYLLFIAKKLGYRIETVPVNFGKRLHGESKWAFSLSSRYKTILRTVKYIFALKGALR